MILLTLIIGGSLTQHYITTEVYDASLWTYSYVEGGVPHLITDACCVRLEGTTAYVATNHLFKGNFE